MAGTVESRKWQPILEQPKGSDRITKHLSNVFFDMAILRRFLLHADILAGTKTLADPE
jgi:hypothetical protein